MADIIFKCPLREGNGEQLLYLSLLFEHRSTPYKFVSIQIGGYLFDAYRDQVKNDQDPLIPVMPFLYYHGKDQWVPLKMDELFDEPYLKTNEFIPSIKFLFENIQNYSDDQIRQLSEGLLTSALLTQKYTGEPELLAEKFNNIFSILESWQNRNLLESLIVYYFDIIVIEKNRLKNLVEKLPEVMKTEFISLADQLRQEGREEELNRKNWTATKNMLLKGVDAPFICDVLDVTPEFVKKVRKEMEAGN